ncbi:hypothetical protein DL89DRAFT_163003 [Linderina pennispora]|uniref:Uncharacterized protein n=1 Tax=Linderina pennispora TaxID=61395 RepID=A0A1Y1W7U4_9FUNG|nr:uncharacterized protein DL89DRAFT_163003 [Linderina pennispora]ORX69589.1 hypothetical protein DL89DRAFT_163003 [Linderina pennispora]
MQTHTREQHPPPFFLPTWRIMADQLFFGRRLILAVWGWAIEGVEHARLFTPPGMLREGAREAQVAGSSKGFSLHFICIGALPSLLTTPARETTWSLSGLESFKTKSPAPPSSLRFVCNFSCLSHTLHKAFFSSFLQKNLFLLGVCITTIIPHLYSTLAQPASRIGIAIIEEDLKA